MVLPFGPQRGVTIDDDCETTCTVTALHLLRLQNQKGEVLGSNVVGEFVAKTGKHSRLHLHISIGVEPSLIQPLHVIDCLYNFNKNV